MVCSSCSCSSCWVREVSLTTIIGSWSKIVYWSLQELTGPVPMSHWSQCPAERKEIKESACGTGCA